MKYVFRTVVGLALLTAGIVSISYCVYQLLQIGTCASGGPYEVARECPPGTERLGFGIPVAVMVMLAGAALYATRGAAPGSTRPGEGAFAVAFIWAGLFLGIAFASFWGVWGPDASPGPGGKLGGLIVGFLFVPMGLLGVIPMYVSAREGSRASRAAGIGVGDALKMARGMRQSGGLQDLMATMERQAAASAAAAPEPVANAGDPAEVVEKLESIQRLRDQGTLTQEEFEKLKRRVLGS